MRLHRFYIEEKIGNKKEISLADSELIHQLSHVFRFGPACADRMGDKVILFDGSGLEYEGEILSLNKKEVKFKINPLVKTQGKDALSKKNNVCLYLSLIKKANFELAAEKCTEIGVSEIHPIISERSEKKDLNLERLNKIVKEASEQSGRLTLPKIFEITDLEKAVSQAINEGMECVAFHTESTSPSIGMSTSPHLMGGEEGNVFPPSLVKEGARGRLCLFVGPEGGWSEVEINLFKINNFKILSLGQNILRAETAAIVATWTQIKNQ
jgi:16S rRNA (uracil1498-N3)-methyltransferase